MRGFRYFFCYFTFVLKCICNFLFWYNLCVFKMVVQAISIPLAQIHLCFCSLALPYPFLHRHTHAHTQFLNHLKRNWKHSILFTEFFSEILSLRIGILLASGSRMQREGCALISSKKSTKTAASCWTTVNRRTMEPPKKDAPCPKTKKVQRDESLQKPQPLPRGQTEEARRITMP